MQDDIKRLENKIDDIADKADSISDRVVELEKINAEHRSLFSEHMKQDERTYEEILRIRESQEDMNQKLAVYNAQLEIHIAGVLELRESNRLLLQKIEQEKQEIDKRLEVAELPIQWALQTGKIAKWIGYVATAIGALVALIKFLS